MFLGHAFISYWLVCLCVVRRGSHYRICFLFSQLINNPIGSFTALGKGFGLEERDDKQLPNVFLYLLLAVAFCVSFPRRVFAVWLTVSSGNTNYFQMSKNMKAI